MMVADTTNVKADKETTSDVHEKKQSETIKEKKESTLFKQIALACVSITVLIVALLARKRWRNNDPLIIRFLIHKLNTLAHDESGCFI